VTSLPGQHSWLRSPTHHAWATAQAISLLEFFAPTVDADGHFCELDDDARPLRHGAPPSSAPQQNLLTVTRAIHCYAAGELLGIPGCAPIVDRGLGALWDEHRDLDAGGYVSAIPRAAGGGDATLARGAGGGDTTLARGAGGGDTTKAAYGHAFVLLAATSALAAGHRQARAVLDDVLAVIDAHFWSEAEGACREAFDRSWRPIEEYRGANSNMHMCEALLAAAEVCERPGLAARADRIAAKLIDGQARANGWLLPEHYDTSWRPRLEYNRDRLDDPFRPYGATIGHSLEWSRLVLGAGIASAAPDGWHTEAAEALFGRAVDVGWDADVGGLAYTVGWDAAPANPDHYWWPIAEGIAAASYLERVTGRGPYQEWYRRFWDFAAAHLIDHERGGWYAQLDASNRRKVHPWYGKPDLYHALQACLLPVLPVAPSLVGAIRAQAVATSASLAAQAAATSASASRVTDSSTSAARTIAGNR
jgi:mannose/cellobiose epimerase-like protein (N-acyl-D-glucosamine 2-epimerase family)